MTIILASFVIAAHIVGHNMTEITATTVELEDPDPAATFNN
ncbi:MAG: hypothetical protein RR554_03615 [Vagococcus sp.]